MVFGLLDLQGAEIYCFLVRGVCESSIQKSRNSGNDQNDSCDLHDPSRSLQKMPLAGIGCWAACECSRTRQ